MSTTTLSLSGYLGRRGYNLDDNRTAGPAAAQATAFPLTSGATRVTVAAATGSFILQDVLTNVAPDVCWVLNDSANSINVYPFSGQNINGALNTPLAVAAGGFALFLRIRATLDWRAAAFT